MLSCDILHVTYANLTTKLICLSPVQKGVILMHSHADLVVNPHSHILFLLWSGTMFVDWHRCVGRQSVVLFSVAFMVVESRYPPRSLIFLSCLLTRRPLESFECWSLTLLAHFLTYFQTQRLKISCFMKALVLLNLFQGGRDVTIYPQVNSLQFKLFLENIRW